MIKNIVLVLAVMSSGLVHASQTNPESTGPLWACAINADIQSAQSFPLPVLSIVRTWEGQGIVECATPQGRFARAIAIKVTKVGAAVGLDNVEQMGFVVPEFGIANWNQLFTSYEFGPSVDATVILVHGEAGFGITMKSSGGLTLQGALGIGPAEGLSLGVSVLGSTEIKDLGPAAGLF